MRITKKILQQFDLFVGFWFCKSDVVNAVDDEDEDDVCVCVDDDSFNIFMP
jgi:hypothetical protein